MQAFLFVQTVEQVSPGPTKLSFSVMVSFCIFNLSITTRRCQYTQGRQQNVLLCQ
jgi:hypothetical protein